MKLYHYNNRKYELLTLKTHTSYTVLYSRAYISHGYKAEFLVTEGEKQSFSRRAMSYSSYPNRNQATVK